MTLRSPANGGRHGDAGSGRMKVITVDCVFTSSRRARFLDDRRTVTAAANNDGCGERGVTLEKSRKKAASCEHPLVFSRFNATCQDYDTALQLLGAGAVELGVLLPGRRVCCRPAKYRCDPALRIGEPMVITIIWTARGSAVGVFCVVSVETSVAQRLRCAGSFEERRMTVIVRRLREARRYSIG